MNLVGEGDRSWLRCRGYIAVSPHDDEDQVRGFVPTASRKGCGMRRAARNGSLCGRDDQCRLFHAVEQPRGPNPAFSAGSSPTRHASGRNDDRRSGQSFSHSSTTRSGHSMARASARSFIWSWRATVHSVLVMARYPLAKCWRASPSCASNYSRAAHRHEGRSR